MQDPNDWNYREYEPVHGSMASSYIMGAIAVFTVLLGACTAIYVNYF